MNRKTKFAALLSVLMIGSACDDFLTGPGLTENPNNPVDASVTAQLVAVQANFFLNFQSQLARSAGIYTQQIMGSNNQQLLWGTRYLIVEGDISGHFNNFYTGSGLLGLRKVQSLAQAAGDPLIEGIAKVWEGFAMGTAASIWGDLPYSQAVDPTILIPQLDTQADVYQRVQTVLSDGIALLNSAPTGGNCDPADLVYCATPVSRALQVSRWVAAANTLKARFHLHLVERNGNAAYTAALAAAQAGILEAPATAAQAIHGQAPGDFRAFHGTTVADGNVWSQFLSARQDIVAGDRLVQLLKDRSDPRLAAYFAANSSGNYVGWNSNEVALPAGQGPPSVINAATRLALNFRQPFVTWAENQLIMAEARFQLQGAVQALPHVNAVRQAVGMAPLVAVTFNDVMLEKYIAMFQNIDVWSDYKRTCIPALTPGGGAAEIPGRLPYGSAERTANPNIPLPSAYPAGTTGSSNLRNWNDPNACP